MKFFGILGTIVVLAIGGAVAFVAMSDVEITQTIVTKDVSPGNLLK